MTKVAFQGMNGAYSQEAIHQYFGDDVETMPCHAFVDLFAAVESQEAEFAILPVENAVAGSVNQSYELLAEHDLTIYAEIILRVRHTLITLHETKPEDIHTVRSHPQALSPCQNEFRYRRQCP